MHSCAFLSNAVINFFLTPLKKITTKRHLIQNSGRTAVSKYSYLKQNCT